MTAPAPSVLTQPVKDALDAVTLARSNLADDTEAQKKLLEAVQKDVDDDKLDADSANGLLAAYGAKAFVKAKAKAPEPPKAEPPKAEPAHNKR